MGNWNRRYYPARKRYRHYDYEDTNPPHDDYSDVSDNCKHNIPQWEIDYCKSVRVPWRKVLASKGYGDFYPSVREWDDSYGEEALNNAKQRYWSSINGLRCEIPLPDPNMYIDEIDWNAPIDSELMAELDRVVQDPYHEQQRIQKLATIEEESGIDLFSNENPWESNTIRGDGVLVDGWGLRVDLQNSKNSNNWEQSCDRPVDSWNHCAWESGNNSWGCKVDLQNQTNWEQNCDQNAGSWNARAWESGNNSWDCKVDPKNQTNWDRSRYQPADSWNAAAWGSGNNSWGCKVDPENQTDWERNHDQTADSWNARARESGNNSWGLKEKTFKPCMHNSVNPRMGNSCAYPRDNVPGKRRWGQRDNSSWNRNARDQELRLNNYGNFRGNKKSADVRDGVWRSHDDKSWVRRGSECNFRDSTRSNRGGRFQVDNYGDKRRF